MGFSSNTTPDFDFRSTKNDHATHFATGSGSVGETPVTKKPAIAGASAFTDDISTAEVALNLSVARPHEEVPVLESPHSHKSLAQSIEHVIKSGEALPQTGNSHAKKIDKRPHTKGADKLCAEATAPAQPAKDPGSLKGQGGGGIAAFAEIKGQLGAAQQQMMEATAQWIQELNALSMEQLKTLSTESEQITTLQQELDNANANIPGLQANIDSLKTQIEALDKDVVSKLPPASHWSKGIADKGWDDIFENSSFLTQLRQQYPSAYTAIQDSLNNGGKHLLGVILENSDPHFVNGKLQGNGLIEFIEGYNSQFTTVMNDLKTYSSQIYEDSKALESYQNTVNTVGGPNGTLAVAEQAFQKSLSKDGITNVTMGNVSGLISLIHAMTKIDATMLTIFMMKLSGSSAIELFSLEKNGITSANQDVQKASASTVSKMDDYNIEITQFVQQLNVQMNQLLSQIDSDNNTVNVLNDVAYGIEGALALATVTAVTLSIFCPPAAPAAWILVGALSAALGAVKLAESVVKLQISGDQKQVAADQKEMSKAMADAQFSEEMASTITQGLTQLSKNLETMIQDGNQVYTNLSASTLQVA